MEKFLFTAFALEEVSTFRASCFRGVFSLGSDKPSYSYGAPPELKRKRILFQLISK
jgi:hypothetical protein